MMGKLSQNLRAASDQAQLFVERMAAHTIETTQYNCASVDTEISHLRWKQAFTAAVLSIPEGSLLREEIEKNL